MEETLRVIKMKDTRRGKLAALTFTEKVRILEKLRDRELKLREAGKKLEQERHQERVADRQTPVKP